MKSLSIAAAEPRIKSAAWWRPCAVFLSGLSLILGLAATAYAKKPIKPPPPPPAANVDGIIYAAGEKSEEVIYKVDLLESGPELTPLFLRDPIESGIVLSKVTLTPGHSDHDGRWFVGAEKPVYRDKRGTPYPLYALPEPDAGTWVAPYLVATHETGVRFELIAGISFQISDSAPPRWFENDSKIAFIAGRIVEGEVDGVTTTVHPVPGTGGIYVADVAFENNIPVLVGEPQLIPFTASLWTNLSSSDPSLTDFSITQDGSTLFYIMHTWDPTNYDECTLYQADMATGSIQEVWSEDWMVQPNLNPAGTAIIYNGQGGLGCCPSRSALRKKSIMSQGPPSGHQPGNRSLSPILSEDPAKI